MKWNIDIIVKMLEEEQTLEEIGNYFGVSKQRIYQILTKYGITTPKRHYKNYLKDKSPRHYWLNHLLLQKDISLEDRKHLVDTLDLPDNCPMLGLPLEYDSKQIKTGFSGRTDNSPSLDRIDSSKGYILGNVHIISWRANRIKNDATVEELGLIYNYLTLLTK